MPEQHLWIWCGCCPDPDSDLRWFLHCFAEQQQRPDKKWKKISPVRLLGELQISPVRLLGELQICFDLHFKKMSKIVVLFLQSSIPLNPIYPCFSSTSVCSTLLLLLFRATND